MIPSIITQCDKKLDFKPAIAAHSAWPIFSWNGIQLNKFNESRAAVEIGSSVDNFIGIVEALYPQLTLSELARIYKILIELKYEPTAELLATRFLGNKYCENSTPPLLDLIEKLPMNLQDFLSRKKLGVHQLSILVELKDVDSSFLLEFLSQFDLSHQQSARAIELAGELILFSNCTDWESMKDLSADKLLKQLKAARYPNANQFDQEQSDRVKGLTFSKKTKVSVNRQGDRSGFNVTTAVFSKSDVSRLMKDLEKLNGMVQ